MDSPVRKQQKRNDYLRHKMFRKINRRRKAERQQAIDAPAKELRRRLRKRKFEDGKDEEIVELPEVRVDTEGNVIADDGRKGTVRLPDITVRPTYLDLYTYYPLVSDYITGHSVLRGVKDTSGGMYINHNDGSFYISRKPENAGYNFVTNNCSDATREALEAATGNKINPYLFTTPGDVQDFFKEQYPDFRVISEGPKTALRAYVTPAEFDRAKAVSDSLQKADAEKYMQEALRIYRETGLNIPKFATGKDSGIHIKPENRGKFTRLKKRTGKSASWFKAHGTPAQKKMAVFALNSRKWSHKK